ncbi:unnamed protein product [Anisakis simplex]|uniref:BPTI/Kunitz inhibitor domain-containing protein n=1 Tax=Anisakis simplex TaxID=6269 RepID=A0A3P6PY17_ANISI|nr:unnamed protein product [Anisakis simplex]
MICSAGDSSQCPDGFYCHIGETRAATACCKTSGGESRCLVPLSVGEGSALIKRFYYDQNEKQCNEFVYKGTKGNENNFLTRDECEKECESKHSLSMMLSLEYNRDQLLN